MTNTFYKKNQSELLLEMKDIQIDGFADNRWHKIIKGMNLKLNKGEVLGLIGESGAGKSTMGKAAMGYTQPGCKLVGGSISFDGSVCFLHLLPVSWVKNLERMRKAQQNEF